MQHLHTQGALVTNINDMSSNDLDISLQYVFRYCPIVMQCLYPRIWWRICPWENIFSPLGHHALPTRFMIYPDRPNPDGGIPPLVIYDYTWSKLNTEISLAASWVGHAIFPHPDAAEVNYSLLQLFSWFNSMSKVYLERS